MSPSYKIIGYETAYRDQVIALQKHLWSQDTALNDAYFAWKYEDNPFVDHIPIYLAVFDGQVVGMRGFMGAEWQVGATSAPVRCLCACDLVVAPSHRGRGLFRKIMGPAMEDLAHRGHPLALNFSASPITFLSSLKMGWQLAGRYKSWRWQTRSKALSAAVHGFMAGKPGLWRHADRRLPLIDRKNPDGFQRLKNYLGKSPVLDGLTLTLSSEPDMDHMIDCRTSRVPDDGRIRHTMTKEYLAWRFRNPASAFAFLCARSDSGNGYLVLHQNTQGDPDEISIADWQADNPETLGHMVRTLQVSGAFDRLVIWSASLDDDARNVFRALAFEAFDDTRGIPGFTPGVIFSPTNNQTTDEVRDFVGSDLTRISAWDLRMIYSDYF